MFPNHVHSKIEKDLLWTNYYYLVDHPKYLIQLIRCIDYGSYKEVINLRENKSIIEKSQLRMKRFRAMYYLCTRSCKTELNYEDAISLLNDDILDADIRQFAMTGFNNVSFDELICFIPFLVFSMRYESLSNFIIGSFLIAKCKEYVKVEFYNEIYWEIQINWHKKIVMRLLKSINIF